VRIGKTYMNMELAKVLGELLLPLCTDVFEVLIAEHDYTSLCNEQSKFVLLRICELGQLESANLSADARRQTGQRYAWIIQQVWFRFVCV
jgi:hypothetical protein